MIFEARDIIKNLQGEPIAVDGHHILTLHERDEIWLVLEGIVDLFIQPEEGALQHLFRIPKNQVFFGLSHLSEPPFKIIAKGTVATSLFQMSWETFFQALHLWEGPIVRQVLDPWFRGLTHLLEAGNRLPDDHQTIPARTRKNVRQGSPLVPAKGLLWLQVLVGGGLLMGDRDLPLIHQANWIPVAELGWLLTHKASVVWAVDTADFMKLPESRVMVKRFHEMVFQAMNIRLLRNLEQDRRRLQEAFENRKRLKRQTSLELFGAAMNLKGLPRTLADNAQPVFEACVLVAKAMGFRLARAKRPRSDELDDICRAYQFRIRRTRLDGTWWHKDNGPLLGFLGENQAPVALIATKPGRYLIVDPVSGERLPVNEATAEQLVPIAFQLYKPLSREVSHVGGLLWHGIRGLFQELGWVFALGCFGGLLSLVVPFAAGWVFDHSIPDGNRNELSFIGLGLIVSALAVALLDFCRGLAVLRLEGKLDANLQAAIWDKLLNLPVSFFHLFTAGDLASRAMGFHQLRLIFSANLLGTLISSLFSFFLLCQLFVFNSRLAIFGLVLILVGLLPSGLGFMQIRLERILAHLEGKITGVVYEMISGIGKIRFSGADAHALNLWARLFAKKKHITYRIQVLVNLVTSWNHTYPMIATMFLFGFLIEGLPLEQRPSTGIFLAFLACFSQLLATLISLSDTLLSSLAAVPIAERLGPILATQSEYAPNACSPGKLSGHIGIRHISFRYEERTPLVLRDVSLTINPGEFVAIVGASGSGKSTLLRLLLGFEKPERGTITFDGNDLTGLDIIQVRRQIGVVLQHSRLMGGDIFSNIVGSLNLSVDDAWSAAEKAGLADDIQEMPMGIHTIISENGVTLSGGQAQRILIARALATNPKVLFFDEATSALDNETQAVVSKSLEELHVTRVVIAHRLETIRKADRIFLLDNGVLAESGSYQDLMEMEGKFYKLANRQILETS